MSHPPSWAHMTWRQNSPDDYQQLLEKDPDHVSYLAAGWSFIECVGGPRDGVYYYYLGSPPWHITLSDVQGDPAPRHHYVLWPHAQGYAIYLYQETPPCLPSPKPKP